MNRITRSHAEQIAAALHRPGELEPARRLIADAEASPGDDDTLRLGQWVAMLGRDLLIDAEEDEAAYRDPSLQKPGHPAYGYKSRAERSRRLANACIEALGCLGDLWRFALANGYEPARLRIPDSPADYPTTTRIASHPGGKHDLLALLIDWDRETCPVCRDQTDDAPLPWRDADREWRSPGRRCLSCGWAEGKVISPQQAAEIRREELND